MTPSYDDGIIEEFRANRGTVGRFGRSLVLLHHVGAKTGTERVSPVMGIRDGEAWFITASKAGADEHPAWYRNLLAHPDVEIETPDDGKVAVHATDLVGAERDAAWAQFLAASPGFRSYEQRTTRIIPVLRLSPRDG
ncbi:nitroreductase family deazaflavin-dependent oxidoreductase [Microbacterium lushaniae]|nr:nitroreductase family deazaflavin-dependent oxidoreductase [Microbacterium lushaniae]KAA9154139.1 nitroreductase family deazaflavin-dependent oxidoreductase [Microbacterium lushaniae]